MKPPTQGEIEKQLRYEIGGRAVPYSLAVDAVDHPRYCIIGDVHDRAEHGSNLCSNCASQLRSDLRLIEDRWDNLEDQLMVVRRKSNGERAAAAKGSAAPIDLDISEAMGLARAAVWAILARLTRDRPTSGFRTDEGTWALAGMLGRYHVDYIAGHPDQEFTETVYRLVWAAGRRVEEVVGSPTARQPIDAHCHQWITATDGSRVPCPGQLEGVVRYDGARVVACSEDPLHMVPMDQWLMLQSRRDGLAVKYAKPTRRS